MTTPTPPVPAASFDFAAPLRYLANGLFQVGFVVPDLRAAAHHFTAHMGVPGFRVLEDVRIADQTVRGAPAALRQDVAFGYAGDTCIELIQVRAGESTYTELLARQPGGGMHHLGVRVQHLDEALAALAALGLVVVQSGRFGAGTRFHYVDTRAAIGVCTEIVYLDADGARMFDDIRNGRA